MNFQSPNLNLNGWTDAHTHGRTDKPKAICPFNFFKVGSIKTHLLLTTLYADIFMRRLKSSSRIGYNGTSQKTTFISESSLSAYVICGCFAKLLLNPFHSGNLKIGTVVKCANLLLE